MGEYGFEVVGLGQCAYDALGTVAAYPTVDQKTELEGFLTQGGGPVATALVTLARLGVATAIQGRVGDDAFGREIRGELEREGVDCRGLRTDSGQSSQFAFIAVEKETGHRNVFWTRGGARPLSPPEIDLEAIRGCRVLHLDGLHLEAALHAAAVAREAGAVTVLDGGTLREGIGQLLPLVDHLVVSEKFARQAGGGGWREGLQALLGYGAAAVTVTRGDQGSCTLTKSGEEFAQPAFPVPTVDTTGCGDVFHGAYIFGLLQGWDLPGTVRFSAAVAALKARYPGGRTGIPSRHQVEDFLGFRF